MRFGKTLQSCVYAPWSDKYIDYSKLKKLLREDGDISADSCIPTKDWTEEDEGAFVDELVNVQLEKVNAFHNDTYRNLRDRTTDCEVSLQALAASGTSEIDIDAPVAAATNSIDDEALLEMLQRLDSITKEVSELEKYSRINFTGFLKAAKKHDRRRGSHYRVRPLLQKLKKEPFLTVWVHPENLLEVKTYILRRLPVLVYNSQPSRAAEGVQHDPRITSLYFDNPGFSLYTDKVSKTAGASSVRLRWFGHLDSSSEIHLEKKTSEESGDSDETRVTIKDKYVQDFITGRYKMEKLLNKLKDRHGTDSDVVMRFLSDVDALQSFIKEHELQPVLRANYARTAFQIPGDDRVRISLDTDVVFLREDSFDPERPCRDPSKWHRTDIDTDETEFPFSSVRPGEISRFPYALLEIKVRDGAKRKTHEWVGDLMSSHLVKESPRFSKFVHGVAQLFEDHVNSFPFWLSDLETDIRRDPGTAFQEEQEKKAKHAEEEQAVGSFMGSRPGRSFTAAIGSPVTKSVEITTGPAAAGMGNNGVEIPDSDGDEHQAEVTTTRNSHGLQSFLPSFSGSRYSRSRQKHAIQLPHGVREPGRLMKDTSPVQVEPKVWLANQRTFVKWQHISVLLATLSLSLYNAAGDQQGVAQSLAIAYTVIATMIGVGLPSYFRGP
ncbi:MAG: hypothetical protein L6R35_002150 [Caloplaca aegaea]|nr:MAG: hypothetical protein L6R35_002150 [Caloplaca aegaea]